MVRCPEQRLSRPAGNLRLHGRRSRSRRVVRYAFVRPDALPQHIRQMSTRRQPPGTSSSRVIFMPDTQTRLTGGRYWRPSGSRYCGGGSDHGLPQGAAVAAAATVQSIRGSPPICMRPDFRGTKKGRSLGQAVNSHIDIGGHALRISINRIRKHLPHLHLYYIETKRYSQSEI